MEECLRRKGNQNLTEEPVRRPAFANVVAIIARVSTSLREYVRETTRPEKASLAVTCPTRPCPWDRGQPATSSARRGRSTQDSASNELDSRQS